LSRVQIFLIKVHLSAAWKIDSAILSDVLGLDFRGYRVTVERGYGGRGEPGSLERFRI
jgi:hypothetical protein